ncbi:hypothetical protein RDWZM_001733 [Blomia tropicalis]|uniref:RING-type domain-containing protein n=1 Tax=Blomia tropicalis TaxID=40697 RepID=A0A9Q0MB71_BLOTA|nr:hypothetical protein RDWZM_001733 [Blomia tropicalis]
MHRRYYCSLHMPWTNDTKFQEFSLSDGIFYTFITNYMLQVTLSITFIYVSGQHMNFAASIAAFFFILPCLTSVSFFMTNKILVYLPTITLLISLIYIFVSLALNVREILKALYVQFMWIKTFVRNYGLYILLESQWTRLHVPQVLRVFWLTRLTEQASFLYFLGPNLNSLYNYNFPSLTMMESPAIIGLKYLLVRGCDNVIAVLGMTSVLSGISHQIGCMMQLFLVVEDPEDRSIGAVSAILFFILALQNGLTAMEPEKRFMRLYRNVCLLFTAILHFIHNMVSPLLFSLSASRNMSINRHCRALIVCIFLFISPIVFLYYLWAHHSLSTWLLAVTAFSFEVIIKVVISLLIYTLFMIDAFRSSMWEQLDDYVYYIRATGNSIEFIFGIFLFFNGAWILLFESGGTIRALMMCIHAYFNIWCQAIAGWKTFIKRRHAVHKINSLPEASAEQLRNFDDVCAICYQELTTARITRCKHYFHSVCLRKWLYLQDICPLCHKTLYNVEQTDGETNSAAPGQAGDPIHVNQPNRLEPLNRDDEVVGRTPEQTNRHEHDD